MNKYLYEIHRTRIKAKAREIALDIMLECEEPSSLEKVMNTLNEIIEKEIKSYKLSSIPEHRSTDFKYK